VVSCGHAAREGVRTRAAAAQGRRCRVMHGGGRGRESRERAGEAGQWAAPQSGSHLSAKEGERGREWQVGSGLRLNVFKLISKVFKI
jgi:hypothetical protein